MHSLTLAQLETRHKVKILVKSTLKSDTLIVYEDYPVRLLCSFSALLKAYFENPTRVADSVTLVSSSKAGVKLLFLWLLYLASGVPIDHYVEIVSFKMALEVLVITTTLRIDMLEGLLENRVCKGIVAQLPAQDIKLLFSRPPANHLFHVLGAETIAAGIIVGEVRDWEELREYYNVDQGFAVELDKVLQRHGTVKVEKRAG